MKINCYRTRPLVQVVGAVRTLERFRRAPATLVRACRQCGRLVIGSDNSDRYWLRKVRGEEDGQIPF